MVIAQQPHILFFYISTFIIFNGLNVYRFTFLMSSWHEGISMKTEPRTRRRGGGCPPAGRGSAPGSPFGPSPPQKNLGVTFGGRPTRAPERPGKKVNEGSQKGREAPPEGENTGQIVIIEICGDYRGESGAKSKPADRANCSNCFRNASSARLSFFLITDLLLVSAF